MAVTVPASCDVCGRSVKVNSMRQLHGEWVCPRCDELKWWESRMLQQMRLLVKAVAGVGGMIENGHYVMRDGLSSIEALLESKRK